MRHSTAHVMAAAVCKLYQQVRCDIGPATADGFYYDFDLSHRLTPDDFPAIEQEMARIIAANIPLERMEMTRDAARAMLEAQGQTYKLERLADIPEGEPISFYRCGDFVDLCRGPHVERTGDIKAFKLLSVAGSYYRGRETNPMLQRLYGLAAASPKELAQRLHRLEEARKRDHRKLGRELDLFSIHDEVGPGLVHWHPKGARIRSLIEDFWRREHFRGGYDLLYTPHIGRSLLWETSGHLGFYRESMYAAMEIDDLQYYLKPMNCPFHIQIYKSQTRSYRNLPLRWAELGTVYRYEKTGVLQGLLRVRGFTQDDAHIFCTPEQIESEVKRTLQFSLAMFHAFGFKEISAYLSTRPAKAIGAPERWAQATSSLEQALKTESIPYQVDEGGGAFYGPKIDLKVQDAIGREWQMSTIQFDFNMPDRFDVNYVGEDGREHRPYMVHRALLGSLERFFGVLIEHYGGAFPLWLAPEQVRVLPLTDTQLDYARGVAEELRKYDIRAAVDESSGKIGAKIRNAQMEKIPYMLIVGPKETTAGQVSVRSRSGGDQGVSAVADFAQKLKEEAADRLSG
ncbi:MAG: threonine--tRNA ligase [Verrucomicrobia bacterium]|nr:threonine--tRNA ligase [Verrucomicrobiota bacterium]MCG2681649.1 threonine--tRNA ligase [Kiritimatiellia bacterium]MBU4248101.1 threonine--tRNA ligase [Verrucomicrobiota bacterium]MBU4290777.1 threonine--tRNA ligase [Verrucomicrobiota bacterium]MBU4429748.1 threonine--tRNA ligase [Verrucomicrobiota bacterium]